MPECGEEVLAAFAEEVEHKLEAFRSFVVGVGDMVGVLAGGEEVGHGCDFSFCFGRWGYASQVGEVGVIHADDQVEVAEVAFADSPAAVVEFETTASGMNPHALVGELSYVVACCPGGVDYYFVGEVRFINGLPHDPLGSGGTADVAEAHEEYFHG